MSADVSAATMASGGICRVSKARRADGEHKKR
jgi:hypothetical protein